VVFKGMTAVLAGAAVAVGALAGCSGRRHHPNFDLVIGVIGVSLGGGE
jgi:hypothetical protein